MKGNKFLVTLTTSIVFISCSSKDQQDITTPAYSNAIIDSVHTNKPIPDSLILKSIMQPGAKASILPGTNTIPVAQSNSVPLPGNSTSGLNPAHGQPGHRCDIAVGAPLNSKPAAAPAATAQPTVVSSQPVATNIVQPVSQKTAPGMNPPHGQPNHRCDIAVGAPLNSKPVTASNIKTQNNAATVVPQPIQKVAPGMNPSHGQPGHRCDIAVGAPLDSKPTTSPAVTDQ